ncbi:MAG: NrdJb, partial [Candidatus Sedimenticola sp. 6PFRAG1]
MAIKIEKSIVEYGVVKPQSEEEQNQAVVASKPEDNIIQMHEKVARPEMLFGSTYKIKTPLSEH